MMQSSKNNRHYGMSMNRETNEPVAWTDGKGNYFDKNSFFPVYDLIPLYTHPVKELTDEEIEGWITDWAKDLYGTLYVEPTDHQRTMAIKMARAILRKAQEK
jgi:hypothetical protein